MISRFVLALLAASCSKIFGMDAPPTTLQEVPKMPLEVPKQTFLCNQWLAKTSTLGDKNYVGLVIDSKGIVYISHDDRLTIWQSLPLSLLEQDVSMLREQSSYFALLPREIMSDTYKRTLTYKEFDPTNYRCVASINIETSPYDCSTVVDSQGTIYVGVAKKRAVSWLTSFFFRNQGKVEIYQKSDPMDPASYQCVTCLECDGNFDSLKEQQGVLFFIFVNANKIDIWKMAKPGDVKTYQRVASCSESGLDTDDTIRVSSSGLIYSVTKSGQLGIWQRTNPNDSSSYKRIAFYDVIDAHNESDCLLRTIQTEMRSELNALNNNAEVEKEVLVRNARLTSFIREARDAKVKEEKRIAKAKYDAMKEQTMAFRALIDRRKKQLQEEISAIKEISDEAEACEKQKNALADAQKELAALADQFNAVLKEKTDALKAFEGLSDAELLARKEEIAHLKARFQRDKGEREGWWAAIAKAYADKISSFTSQKFGNK